jgi:hypothetical protein
LVPTWRSGNSKRPTVRSDDDSVCFWCEISFPVSLGMRPRSAVLKRAERACSHPCRRPMKREASTVHKHHSKTSQEIPHNPFAGNCYRRDNLATASLLSSAVRHAQKTCCPPQCKSLNRPATSRCCQSRPNSGLRLGACESDLPTAKRESIEPRFALRQPMIKRRHCPRDRVTV